MGGGEDFLKKVLSSPHAPLFSQKLSCPPRLMAGRKAFGTAGDVVPRRVENMGMAGNFFGLGIEILGEIYYNILS